MCLTSRFVGTAALVWIVGLAVISTAVEGQISPEVAASQMGRGINLGNTLEPPNEGEWNNGPAQEAYFDEYAAAGFSTVRIPVRWDQHTGTSVPYAIDQSFLERVEEVADWALDRNLFVVINAHHEDWLKATYDQPASRARFDSIWVQVARHFADKSDSLFFEIINEPFGMSRDDVDDLNARVLQLIRASNPTRIVMYSGNEYSAAAQLFAAAIPDDPYIMGYYHSYDPWEFAGLANREWGTEADIAELRAQIESAKDWSDQNSVVVTVSEFGAVVATDYNSRMRYLHAYTSALIEYELPFQVWDDGGDFEVLKRSELEWHDSKDILIHTYPDGPDEFDVSITTDSTVTLTWNNQATHTEIRVERATGDSSFQTIATLSAADTTYVDADADTATQEYRYRIMAVNAISGNRYSHPLRTSIQQVRSSFIGEPHSIPGVIEAEDFDLGGEGLAYHDSDAVNIPGGYRPDEAVDIENRVSGGFHIGYVEAGEWVEHSVNVQEAGTYVVEVEVASLLGGGRVHILVGQSGSERMVVPATGDWETTVSISSQIELQPGEQVMRISIVSLPEYNIDRVSFTRVDATTVQRDSELSSFEIYPNPANSRLYLIGPSSMIGQQVSIVDITGRSRLFHTVKSERDQISVSSLSPGIYFLDTDSPAGKKPAKIVIAR
ncbi:MAG: cellulase family glycosylhydrolase [Rhodothermales bacterium]|nr:cellulase family glycosylhydrolase [Rhodothermales bacterium]